MAIRRPPTTFSDTISTADIADDAVTSAKLDTNLSVAGTLGVTGALTASGGIANSGTITAGTLGSSVVFPSGKFIPLKNITRSNGSSTATGNNVDMLSISVDLSNYQNYILFAFAHTAISENSNHSNTTILRIRLHNSSTYTTLSSQRQGMGSYSGNDSNHITTITCQGYYEIASAYATSCTLKMNGGINSSGDSFSWGDQASYTNFDDEAVASGGTLGFFLFHP